MRWLLLKDLQILRRSPLLVSLLVLYPIVLAVLIGLGLSRGPDKPRVAILNEVPPSAATIDLGGQKIDTARYARQLFTSVDAVSVQSRDEALQKVRSGDALAAVIVPPDATQKLASGLEPASIEVLYNAEDPVKATFVRNTIAAQVQAANLALTKQLTKVALGDLNLIVKGGDLQVLGRSVPVLGLADSVTILRAAEARLPPGSAERAGVERVASFAALVRDNVGFSTGALAALGEPIRVDATAVNGGTTPLSSLAVAISATLALMVVTLLLAAGMLALEREENAFRRLVRGLVSGSALLAEKVVLAAACAVVVALVMLAGLTAFVALDWHRFPLWVVALVAGALGFGAMGAAIGALAREVRAASLLAFMVSLPIAFLALVPSGSVSSGLYAVVRAVSALFPFKPTLQALNAALNGGGGLVLPLVHLGLLVLAFAIAARLALRRFA